MNYFVPLQSKEDFVTPRASILRDDSGLIAFGTGRRNLPPRASKNATWRVARFSVECGPILRGV